MGRDKLYSPPQKRLPQFQLTRPHGARWYLHRDLVQPSGFNSRARMGAILSDALSSGRAHVSTHAPAWGAIIARSHCLALVCFNSRPHGARFDSNKQLMKEFTFQSSRARMGRDVL